MSNEDKMLQLVLSDNNLSSFYEYNANDFQTIDDALDSENPIVVTVAKIIRGLQNNLFADISQHKETYTETFNYLKNNLL